MSRTQMKWALGLLGVLFVANVARYFLSDWGLITVRVSDVPIGQVIRSIERQGWVTIYSNIDPQTKISMYVDHVTLPEAMETLAVNAEAQWHLGFFVGPNAAQVKSEIRTFTEAADESDDTKIYSYPTPFAMLSGDSDGDDSNDAASNLPVPDPRRQTWPGVKPPAPAPAPDANATASTGDGSAPPVDPPPSSAQGYLKSFAQGADIWVMAPADWDPPVAVAPPPQSSISSAIDRFVGSLHGSVTQAFVLRGRPPRVAGERRRGPGGGGGMDFSLMQDRMDNAINGLPPSYQPIARAQLVKEVAFQKEVQQMPPEERWKVMGKRMLDRRMEGFMRASPEQRAKMYARMVSNRMAAQGK